jgi:CubicO group peptidase (beta-lactamase class C family)
MNTQLTRRQFLQMSGAAAAGLWTLGYAPFVQAKTPHLNQDFIQIFMELDQIAAGRVRDSGAPGMAYAVVIDDRLVHAKGIGVMELGNSQPVNTQSVQPVASMSKAFTAVAVMQLVERGLLDIYRPYIEYIPYFELQDPRYPRITIRHLLAHNAGFPWITDAEFYDFGKDPWHDDGAMERYVRSLKDMDITLDFDPGAPDGFAYSNMGYDILGDLIHKVSGELFEHYCAKHILEPLGMSHATFLKSDVPPGLLEGAHTRDEDNKVIPCPYYPYDRKHAPSACLFTSIMDMSRWARMHLNGGELNGRRILTQQSHELLWQPLITPWENFGYGWGWSHWFHEIGSDRYQIIGHPGANPGVDSLIVFAPELSLAVMSQGNLNGGYDDYASSFVGVVLDRIIPELA